MVSRKPAGTWKLRGSLPSTAAVAAAAAPLGREGTGEKWKGGGCEVPGSRWGVRRVLLRLTQEFVMCKHVTCCKPG